DYIGEIRLSRGSYTEAMRLFETAIRLCEKESLSASLTQFYIDAGRTCYASGDEDAARDYFERAYRLNSEYDPFWRRAMLEGYLALLAAKEQQFRRALQHLSAAQENANRIKSPSDFGMVCGVKAVLRRWMDADARMRKSFSRQLRDDAETYRAQALKNLNAFVDTCEIAQLEKIFK
ncbi:MAG: tetratricopeptide repeat protein, partial [Oscillospiraceae bacterium]|nr:tetratricopeptide repeat protein [Oscillospiraceae bacterium]